MGTRAFTNYGHHVCAAAHIVRTAGLPEMVRGQGTLRFLRHCEAGRKAREAHGGYSGRILRVLSLCFARALRSLAEAPETQSLVCTAQTECEPDAIGCTAGTRVAAH